MGREKVLCLLRHVWYKLITLFPLGENKGMLKGRGRARSALTEDEGKSPKTPQVCVGPQPPRLTWQPTSASEPVESEVVSN